MNAVIQVDVRVARRPVQRRIPLGRTRRGMTGRIGLADVGLRFDDHAARQNAAAIVDQHLADEIAGDVERRTIVEGARQLAHDRYPSIVQRPAAYACDRPSARMGRK